MTETKDVAQASQQTAAQQTARETTRETAREAARATARATTDRSAPKVRPPVDVFETEHNLVLYADVPGVASTDLNVAVEDKVLRIEAAANLDTPADMKVAYAEFRTPRYVREFTLSNELDTQNIDAALRNGLLVLTIPKQEHAKPKKISVAVR